MKRSRRTFIKTGTATVLALVASACGDKLSPAVPSDESVGQIPTASAPNAPTIRSLTAPSVIRRNGRDWARLKYSTTAAISSNFVAILKNKGITASISNGLVYKLRNSSTTFQPRYGILMTVENKLFGQTASTKSVSKGQLIAIYERLARG